MKSQNTSIRHKYVKRSDGLHSTVCKDIPPKSARKAKKERIPKGRIKREVFLPPEYEAALLEIYPDLSVPLAIRKFIVDNIELLTCRLETD